MCPPRAGPGRRRRRRRVRRGRHDQPDASDQDAPRCRWGAPRPRGAVGTGSRLRTRRVGPVLLENARQLPVPTESPPKSDEVLAAERRERACAKVRIGEVSRASPSFDCSGARTGHGGHLPRPYGPPSDGPRQREHQSPPEVLAHDPLDPVQLSAWAVATALREARRGGAPGLSGMRAEHLKTAPPGCRIPGNVGLRRHSRRTRAIALPQ